MRQVRPKPASKPRKAKTATAVTYPASEAPRPIGRPSIYSDEIASQVWVLLAAGHSLRKICTDPRNPCRTTIYQWIQDNADFAHQYARAREMGADAWFDKLTELAESVTPETAAADRVKADILKWAASKLRPRVYGDRVTNEVTGADGGAIKVESVVTDEDRVQALILFMNRNGLTFGPVKAEASAERDLGMVEIEPEGIYHGPTGICKK